MLRTETSETLLFNENESGAVVSEKTKGDPGEVPAAALPAGAEETAGNVGTDPAPALRVGGLTVQPMVVVALVVILSMGAFLFGAVVLALVAGIALILVSENAASLPFGEFLVKLVSYVPPKITEAITAVPKGVWIGLLAAVVVIAFLFSVGLLFIMLVMIKRKQPGSPEEAAEISGAEIKETVAAETSAADGE